MPVSSLCQGMYARVPYETRLGDGDFRNYRIGRIKAIDDDSLTVTVQLFHQYASDPLIEELLDCSAEVVERCELLPESACLLQEDEIWGRLLAPVSESPESQRLAEYFVSVDGQIRRISESELVVPSTRQRPDPFNQLRRYEFHHPTWREARDPLIDSYAELRNATFGIEDLIGSRVLLLPHQAEVVARALSDPICRFALADEVGLGKTIEAAVILKGLFRRDAGVKSLVVVPAALLQQWHNELNAKFWLTFSVARSGIPLVPPLPEVWMGSARHPGIIVSQEDLTEDDQIWHWLLQIDWGLLVVDEAHHIQRSSQLQRRLIELSQRTPRALILSATPIQRRAEEYLDLLKLMDPTRYARMGVKRFHEILAIQDRVREAVMFLAPALSDDLFDLREFQDELSALVDLLDDDEYLSGSMHQLSSAETLPDRGLGLAREILSYVAENYRVEGRVIRNRRAHLSADLPQRTLDAEYSYTPSDDELATLDALAEYVDFVRHEVDSPLTFEYCRVLLHAASSSPHQLTHILSRRLDRLQLGTATQLHTFADLSGPGPPRQEEARIGQLIDVMPLVDGERDMLEDVRAEAGRWLARAEIELEHVGSRRSELNSVSNNRLVQTLRAINAALQVHPRGKLVLFSSWPRTIDALAPRLERLFGRDTIAQFRAGMDASALQQQVDEYQKNPRCQVLLSDELGGEGRNFQIADQIIHVDLPWTPARIEQRIGRVDRLGRAGVVRSVVPFAIGTVEHDLFRIWQDAFSLFTQSMSGLEIALENVQDELRQAIARSPRHGLAGLFDQMVAHVAELRREVEQERYFEEGAINHGRRAEFRALSEKYRDGKLLQRAIMQWADMAGLRHDCDPISDICTFSPRRFNHASMANAKFFNPPDMQEAVRRSGRRYEHTLRGTFNRVIAVQREDLIFFAPGDDPWFDAIIGNALEADRGCSCAILRYDERAQSEWHGLELRYTIQVDPRPLFAAGFDPIHLYRAKGFLHVPTHSLLLSHDGVRVPRRDPAWAIIKDPFSKLRDVHLGKREGPGAPVEAFRSIYPRDMWEPLIERLSVTAAAAVAEDFDFMADSAADADDQFRQQTTSWRSVQRWLARELGQEPDFERVEEFERIAKALAEGIAHPLIQLESACFWIIRPRTERTS